MESIRVTLGKQTRLSRQTRELLETHSIDCEDKRISGEIEIWAEPILRGEESFISRLELEKRGRKQNALQSITVADELISYHDRFPRAWQDYFFFFPRPRLTDQYGNTDLIPLLCRNPLIEHWFVQFIWFGHVCAAKPRNSNYPRRAHFMCWSL